MARLVLGDVEITRICYGVYRWDGGAFFGVVPKTLWSRKLPADEQNRIDAAFNCYLVRTGDRTHPDRNRRAATSWTPAPASGWRCRPSTFRSLTSSRAHGFDPDSIDIVVNSHLHWDHCGGNTVLGAPGESPRPAFPSARYFASRPEWEHAHERLSRDGVSYNDANYDPLVGVRPDDPRGRRSRSGPRASGCAAPQATIAT